MHNHHHITKYNIEFNEYATLTRFNKRTLYAKYYKGLAPRIKDGMVYSGCPDNLANLRTQAMNLDLRYWERKDEDKYRTLSNSGNQLSKSFSASSNAMSSSSSSSRAKTPHPKSQSRSSTLSSPSPRPKSQDLSKILGPDGKLLPEEKEHHKRLGLCIICSSKAHMLDKCPSHKEPAQGRAAYLDSVFEQSADVDSTSEAESSDSQN